MPTTLAHTAATVAWIKVLRFVISMSPVRRGAMGGGEFRSSRVVDLPNSGMHLIH
jgi:hypothetical protein